MGTSENLLHDHFAVNFSVCFVVKPCNTYSITAAFRLAYEKNDGRKLIRVPVFREPLMLNSVRQTNYD